MKRAVGFLAALVLTVGLVRPCWGVELTLTSHAALLMEKTTGQVLYARNEHEQLEPASVTKIMTLLLTMDAIDSGALAYDDVVTVSANAAGMGGRTHFWTNAYDPGENSYAQQQFETSASDVWIFYRNPDLNPDLRHKDGTPYSFNNRRERRKILEWVYAGSPWVPLDSVEAEAEALMEKDPAQAERFFGNRMVQGGGAWLEDGLWESCYAGQ